MPQFKSFPISERKLATMTILLMNGPSTTVQDRDGIAMEIVAKVGADETQDNVKSVKQFLTQRYYDSGGVPRDNRYPELVRSSSGDAESLRAETDRVADILRKQGIELPEATDTDD